MKQYNTYIKNTNKNALREFNMTVDELLNTDRYELTERQREFIKYYYIYMPVGISDCVMNKICRRFEEAFDGFNMKRSTATSFDYSFMKSKEEYSPKQFKEIKKLFDDYNRRLKSYAIFADYERIDECDSVASFNMMNEDFQKQCSYICPNDDALCNIVLDMCYSKSCTKRFAWNMCGSAIIKNLLKSNNYEISYLVLDDAGDIEYGGNTFSVESRLLEV